MALIPEQPAEDRNKILFAWYEARLEHAKLQAKERILREKVVKLFFPTPKEGTNTTEASPGYNLKMTYSFDRKVDEGQLQALKALKVSDVGATETLKLYGMTDEDIAALMSLDPNKLVIDVLGISVDKMLRYKPELATKEWRTLTAEQHKVFDAVLEIKPGSPQVTIEPTAEKKKELEAAAAPKAPEPALEIPVFVGGSKPPF